MIRRLDHIAVVVENLERALGVFGDALGLSASEPVIVPGQGVRIACLPVGESEIELLEPIDQDSGVARFLASKGEGLHHICLEVEDVDAALEELRAKGVRLINETAVAGGHGRVAFIHPKATFGVLIELVQRDE
jgi:methylmalonyl-CoA/ethylmalonyl-CoA epimerase